MQRFHGAGLPACLEMPDLLESSDSPQVMDPSDGPDPAASLLEGKSCLRAMHVRVTA
jgi:hypothetical protein